MVLGFAFGDEGKGTAVQWLCKKATKYGRTPLVVRFSGGAQAAHTIVQNDKVHICSTYGGGVLLGTPTALFKDVFFDPICAYNEYKLLTDFNPKLYIDERCRVVTPYDVAAGRVDKKVVADGTCGKGIYQTFKRHNDTGARFPFGNWGGLDNYLNEVANYYGFKRDLEAEFLFANSYKSFPHDGLSKSQFANVGEVVFEGSQGLLLDMERGFWPNVTPSNTGLENILEYSDVGECLDVYLVTRTYLTRHGNGYFPDWYLPYKLNEKFETNVKNEYQGEFKVGALNFDLLFDSVKRHCLDNMAKRHNIKFHLLVTHGDVSIQNGYIAYILGGQPNTRKVKDVNDIKNLFVESFKRLPNFDFYTIYVSFGKEGVFI